MFDGWGNIVDRLICGVVCFGGVWYGMSMGIRREVVQSSLDGGSDEQVSGNIVFVGA